MSIEDACRRKIDTAWLALVYRRDDALRAATLVAKLGEAVIDRLSNRAEG